MGHIADWSAIVLLAVGFLSWTGLMTWAASSISAIAEHGWGAVLFAALGMMCLIALAVAVLARAILSVVLYFRPAAAPVPLVTALSVQADPTQRFPDYSEKLHQIDRTALLLSNAVIEWIYQRRVAECLGDHPGEGNDLTSNETMNATREKYQDYLDMVSNKLRGSSLGEELFRILGAAETQANHELLICSTPTPADLHPQQYRLFYIAYKQSAAVKKFLKQTAIKADDYEQQTLQNVRERFQFHNKA